MNDAEKLLQIRRIIVRWSLTGEGSDAEETNLMGQALLDIANVIGPV